MGSIPLAAAASRDAGGCFEEVVRGRSAHLFKLAMLLTGQNQADAGGRAMGYRAASLGARAHGVPRLFRVIVSWLVAGSRESSAGRMVGAAVSRRAGLGSAATALVLVLTAAAGCASPERHTPGQGYPGAHAAAATPRPAVASLPRVRGGLPWPVTLRTADGMFVITRTGAIRWLGPAQPARAQAGHGAGFVWVNRSEGTWAMIRDGHLVIMRNRSVIWHSAARYAVRDAAHMVWILAGRPGIAFEVHPSGPWFIASGRGPEHRVAVAGWPEMWTRSGNLIVVLHRPHSRRFGYAVYSPSGIRLATLATGLRNSVADQRVDDLGTGTFWYLTGGGNLFRTDGTAARIIANTHALGLTGIPGVGVLRGGLVQLLSGSWRQGQVILHPDGQRYARIAAPKGDVAGFGELSASPDRRMVAYILTKEPGNSPTVFVVRPGGAPVAVYRAAHGGSPCSLPPLAWHGSWLLYTPHEGRPVLIDTAGSHRIIRLPPALPGSNGRTLRVHAVSWRLGLPVMFPGHPVRRGT